MSIQRDLTSKVEPSLQNDEILLFVGARQAGKTTLLRQLEVLLKGKGESTHFLNLEDPDYLKLLEDSPKNLLKIFPFDLQKRTCVFVDEVQYLSNPTNFLKYFYDEYRGRIKLIASGSSAFYIDKKFKDSLAGRKRIFPVHTLSFREFLRFKTETELAQRDFEVLSLSEIEKIELLYREYFIFGGYPRVVLAPLEEKKDVLRDIAYSYIKKDVLESGVRQEDVFYRLFKMLASQIGNLANVNELSSALEVSNTSITSYLHVMQKSFHIQLIRPFSKNMRKELVRMPKVYFLDLGLRNFFANNFSSYELREDKGSLLENAVYRQLLEVTDSEEIRFWRTAQKHEVDFVIGGERAIEVKARADSFKEKSYRSFKEYYPEIKFCIATLDVKEAEKKGIIPVIQAWKL